MYFNCNNCCHCNAITSEVLQVLPQPQQLQLKQQQPSKRSYTLPSDTHTRTHTHTSTSATAAISLSLQLQLFFLHNFNCRSLHLSFFLLFPPFFRSLTCSTDSPTPKVKEEPAEEEEELATYVAQWPFQDFCADWLNNIFDSSWEVRHGAVLALKEVLKYHIASAGKYCGLSLADNKAR